MAKRRDSAFRILKSGEESRMPELHERYSQCTEALSAAMNFKKGFL